MPLGQALHRRVMNDFRTYMLVGGMPQAVCEFVRSGDLEQVDRIKRRIVNLYREDVSKFAKGYEARVFAIFDQIPSQLSKREKKFKLADLCRSARFRSYKDAFVWLDETMVVNTCLNAEDPGGALAMSADHSTLKCYMGDTGLLVTLAFWDQAYHDNDLYRAILLDRMNVNEGCLRRMWWLRCCVRRAISCSSTLGRTPGRAPTRWRSTSLCRDVARFARLR